MHTIHRRRCGIGTDPAPRIMRQEPKKLPFPAFRFLKLRRRINQRNHCWLTAVAVDAMFPDPAHCPGTVSADHHQAISSTSAATRQSPASSSSTPVRAWATCPPDRAGFDRSAAARLKDARRASERIVDRRCPLPALELLDELPPGSKVAVIGTDDRDAVWALSSSGSPEKIRELKKPRVEPFGNPGCSNPLTTCSPETTKKPSRTGKPASTVDAPFRIEPSLRGCHSVAGSAILKERVPPPAIHSAYVDVGIDKPDNLAIRPYRHEAANRGRQQTGRVQRVPRSDRPYAGKHAEGPFSTTN
jgi:hypothetical protein